MKPYPKIHSIFKRDPQTNYSTFLDEYSNPVFEFLSDCQWTWREKIDGRNHRVIWDGKSITHKGRTERSQFSNRMLQTAHDIVSEERFKGVFGDKSVCLYGELYGEGIQKGGDYIQGGQGFILFDILIGDYWIRREDMEGIADNLGLDVVPIVGQGTLHEAVEYTRKGFNSKIGTAQSEGLVLLPAAQLFDRMGQRIITKVKTKDYENT